MPKAVKFIKFILNLPIKTCVCFVCRVRCKSFPFGRPSNLKIWKNNYRKNGQKNEAHIAERLGESNHTKRVRNSTLVEKLNFLNWKNSCWRCRAMIVRLGLSQNVVTNHLLDTVQSLDFNGQSWSSRLEPKSYRTGPRGRIWKLRTLWGINWFLIAKYQHTAHSFLIH